MDKLEKGEHIYNPSEERLLSAKNINDVVEALKTTSLCEVGNASCQNFIVLDVLGIHPEKPQKHNKIMICSLGCNEESCVLNK